MPKYPGAGQATLVNANQQVVLMNAERTGTGTPNYASVAFNLERQKSSFYPWGFAIEIVFSGAPGTFEVDVQGAETDTDANYCLLGTAVSSVNSSNVCRFDNTTTWPKFVRIFVKTLTNDVLTSAVLTR